MKTLLTAIILFLPLSNIFGQNFDEAKYRFAKEAFDSKTYVKKDYPKFDKRIEIVENGSYKFGDKFLKVSLEYKGYEKLFSLGIFNPDIIFGSETSRITKADLDSLSQNQRVFYNLIRNDSLAICCLESLEKLHKLND